MNSLNFVSLFAVLLMMLSGLGGCDSAKPINKQPVDTGIAEEPSNSNPKVKSGADPEAPLGTKQPSSDGAKPQGNSDDDELPGEAGANPEAPAGAPKTNKDKPNPTSENLDDGSQVSKSAGANAQSEGGGNWPMWGGTPGRNMRSSAEGL